MTRLNCRTVITSMSPAATGVEGEAALGLARGVAVAFVAMAAQQGFDLFSKEALVLVASARGWKASGDQPANGQQPSKLCPTSIVAGHAPSMSQLRDMSSSTIVEADA